MSKCGAIKASGERCKAVAIRGSEWCPAHHPDHQEQRKRAAKKGGKRGGRGRPQGELAEIKAQLRELAEQVLAGDVDRSDAVAVGQLYNTVIRAVGVELKVKEQTDFLERLEALEQAQEGSKRWGA